MQRVNKTNSINLYEYSFDYQNLVQFWWTNYKKFLDHQPMPCKVGWQNDESYRLSFSIGYFDILKQEIVIKNYHSKIFRKLVVHYNIIKI